MFDYLEPARAELDRILRLTRPSTHPQRHYPLSWFHHHVPPRQVSFGDYEPRRKTRHSSFGPASDRGRRVQPGLIDVGMSSPPCRETLREPVVTNGDNGSRVGLDKSAESTLHELPSGRLTSRHHDRDFTALPYQVGQRSPSSTSNGDRDRGRLIASLGEP